MKYATVCSGINAPAEAWNSMGWQEQFCAEIEPFPSAVLAQRHPQVPNLGDITKYEDWPDFGIELLCGGTPCQSFSLAGLRKGMDDPRGQLTRTFIQIAARYRPRWLLWENVPGVLSADGGDAFAGFLGGLSGRKVEKPKEGWKSFGIVPGIQSAYGLAWRVLDTQFVRVDSHPRACPQRRERVFVVGHLGGCWQRAAAVLLERESLQGNPAPRRTAGKGTARDTAPSLTGSGRGVARPGDSRGQDPVVAIAGTIGARGTRSHSELDGHGAHVVSHTLAGVESDASEDGTGRGTPLVADVSPTISESGGHARPGDNVQSCLTLIPVAFVADDFKDGTYEPCDTARPLTTSADRERSAPILCMAHGQANAEIVSDGSPSLTCNHEAPIVAFSAKDFGGDATEDLSPTLRAMQHDGSHANGGGQMAVAIQGTMIGRDDRSVPSGCGHSEKGAMFTLTKTDVHAVAFQPRIARYGRGNMGDAVNALQAQSGGTGKGDSAPCVATGTAVRRLTPRECERLQGFSDDYTRIPWRGKPESQCPDGPRYKALGNSMSCNVMRWLGLRIQMVDDLPHSP